MGEKMVNVNVDGQTFQVKEGTQVSQLRKEAGIPSNRKLFKQGEKGFENPGAGEVVKEGGDFGTIPEYRLG